MDRKKPIAPELAPHIKAADDWSEQDSGIEFFDDEVDSNEDNEDIDDSSDFFLIPEQPELVASKVEKKRGDKNQEEQSLAKKLAAAINLEEFKKISLPPKISVSSGLKY